MQSETRENVLWGIAGMLLGVGMTILIPTYPIWGGVLVGVGSTVAAVAGYLHHKETRLKSLKYSIRHSKVVWAFWYSGQQVLDNNIVKIGEPTSLKKVILLKPDLDNGIFRYIADLAGEDTPKKRKKLIENINVLEETLHQASSKVEVYYHEEKLTYTFTIFDESPIGEEPKSKNAVVVVQALEPKRASERKAWHKWIVRNKGNSKDQFEAYYKLFGEIEKRAELQHSNKE